MKFLITGANGFIGRNLIKRLLLNDNNTIIGIDIIDFDDVNASFKYYKVSEDDDFLSIVQKERNIDVVIHLAALVHQSKQFSDEEYYRVNTTKTIVLAEAAKKANVKHFIFMSTLSVYGLNDSKNLLTEDYPADPVNGYGKSKYSAEIGLRKIETGVFKVAIIRSPLIYGPNVKGNMLSMIRFIDNYPIIPLGNIKNKRTMVSIDNLISLMELIINKDASGVFMAGDPDSVSTSELVEMIVSAMRKKRIILPIPIFMQKIIYLVKKDVAEKVFGSLELNCSKTNNSLGHLPLDNTAEEIKKMVDTYIKNNIKK